MRILLSLAAVLVSGGVLLASAAGDAVAMALAKESRCLDSRIVDKRDGYCP